MIKRYKKIITAGFILFLLCITAVITTDLFVKQSVKEYLYNSVEAVPHNKVGLFLGTGKFLSNGEINLYYKYRIQAAALLYKSGKVDYILVSGDNSKKDYDEPTTIKTDLIALGIPAGKIYLDYAGFRTLDSVVRCKKIFGQQSITVISQQFHNERAVFLAKHNDIKAVGFNAKAVNKRYGMKTRIREKLARVKMMLDLLSGKEPRFLGEKIIIE